MAKRRRKKSRRRNPEYSEAVTDIVMDFIEVLDKASNAGYKAVQRIQTKTGDVQVASAINRIAEMIGDASEELEDVLY
ncbi:hypothetical protein HOO68_05825 [Candidatus Gracilibacteria bacterium]|nr:hypothetical protein [Candidatus Gracilibacteria bacterium]